MRLTLSILRGASLICILLLASSLVPVARAEEPSANAKKDAGLVASEALDGKTIRTISVELKDVFEEPDGFLYRTANSLKINTKEKIIRRELLFKEGDTYDHFLIQESERSLRAQRYLRGISILAYPDGDSVDLKVKAQDTWTLIPQVSFSSGQGQDSRSIGLGESNIMGYGKRGEVLYTDENNRTSLEGVYEDPRLFGSSLELVGGEFHRKDGDRSILLLSNPFRTLVDKTAWTIDADVSDTVGRLFANGDERYIYRQHTTDVGAKYTWAFGDPEVKLRRYSLGYDYIENTFDQADSQDYQDLDLDPSVVSNDIAQLASPRRYTGPTLGYESINPRFISMNYIDRFDRVEDYNIGDDFSILATIAPKELGSIEDAVLINGNRSAGAQFSETSFLRGEFGFSSRYADQDFSNSLFRTETRYYDVLGPLFLGGYLLGRHTLAAGLTIDYGKDLDKDREFLLGAENGLRGYDSRTFTGDKRLVMNLEDRVHLIDDAFKLFSVGAAAFVDAGGSTDEKFGTLFQENLYGDFGVGLRFGFPRSSGGRVLRMDIALPFRDGPDGASAYEVRLILAGGQIFSSKLRSESVGSEKANVEVGFDK